MATEPTRVAATTMAKMMDPPLLEAVLPTETAHIIMVDLHRVSKEKEKVLARLPLEWGVPPTQLLPSIVMVVILLPDTNHLRHHLLLSNPNYSLRTKRYPPLPYPLSRQYSSSFY